LKKRERVWKKKGRKMNERLRRGMEVLRSMTGMSMKRKKGRKINLLIPTRHMSPVLKTNLPRFVLA
jgi:hypothetical protein